MSFGAEPVLEDIEFEIKNKKDKIAVIGRNGSGKTTLLKLISGEIELYKEDGAAGSIMAPGNPTIGYLKQITFDDLSITLDEEIRKVFSRVIKMGERLDELVALMNENAGSTLLPAYSDISETFSAAGDTAALGGVALSADDALSLNEKLAAEYTYLQEEFLDIGGYYYEKEYDIMLKSFGFSPDDKNKRLGEFSGGQLTKLAFIKLLLSKPDILLLDEPTNHLDISTIAWLEGYLKDYNRAVVIVSHDRMFLDRIVNNVYEITYGKIIYFPGNYTDYVRQKKERYERQLKEHIAQQKEIKRLTELIERFKSKPTKVAMTRSKLKAIEHMELVARPADYDTKSFKASFTPRLETGKDVLMINGLEIGYDKCLARVSLDLKRSERLGIVGDNGIGKSTLLKTLVGAIKPMAGEFRFGVNVEIGYFDQQMAQVTSDKTVLEDFWDEFPNMMQTEVRNALGAFLFTQDEVYKEVSMLSGGERVRLQLAKLFQKKPNVLILDEPTNHMDLIGKETLEAMLKSFEGTVIFVSHDRYFVKQVATTILSMTDKGVKLYPFGYDSYEEDAATAGGSGAINTAAGAATGKSVNIIQKAGSGAAKGAAAEKLVNITLQESPEPTAAMTSYMAGKDAARKKKRIAKIEEEIDNIEGRINEIEAALLDPANSSNYQELTRLNEEKESCSDRLLELMEEWDLLDAEINA